MPTDEQAALKAARTLVNEHELVHGIITNYTGLSHKIATLILRERAAAAEQARIKALEWASGECWDRAENHVYDIMQAELTRLRVGGK